MAECNQCFKTSDGTIKLCYECLEAESTLNLEAAAKAYTACGNYQKRIKELEALRDTVSINCNPPDHCKDPVVLKTYMKACFDEAEKLY